jgi:GPH family glycoside/pentoside/hexuronide:cation symporter
LATISNVKDQLSLGRKLGFTVGDYACNLYWQSLSIFLLFFYTDAVGLSAATAGFIYMIASIWDGAIDPVIGALADRTRSRYGRYRGYILFGAVPLALTFALLYYKPPLTGTALVVWLLATHMIFRTTYAVLSIPYTSLTARVTSSSKERSTLAGLRIIFAVLAALTISFFTQPLVGAFGGGQGQGYFGAACVFGVVATLIFPIVFATTREPPIDHDAEPQLRLRDYWKAIRLNRAFWVVMACIVCAVICSTTLTKSILYYFKYYLNDEAASRVALSLNAAAGLLITPLWMVASRWIGKRTSWFLASALGLAGLAWFAAVDVRSVALMFGFFVGMNVALLGLYMTFWSMLPDTVEYGEWRSGVRTESFVFGLGQFFLKVSLGFGAGLFGWALDLVGYVPNVAQSASTLHGLKTIMVVLPVVGVFAGCGVMLLYPLRNGVHEQIVEQLDERKRAARAQLAPEAS